MEKEHLEEGEIEEIEDTGVGKIPYKPEYQYSREELLKYSDHPLSRQRPIINDPNVDGLNCWLKSSNWNNYKRSDTPTERGDDSYKVRNFVRSLRLGRCYQFHRFPFVSTSRGGQTTLGKGSGRNRTE